MAERRIELHSESESQTIAIAAALGRNLHARDVVALEGELGAGKTVFVRGLAGGLQINPNRVSSPTFVIRQEYEPADPINPTLVHIDAYRLSGPEELEGIGWQDLLSDAEVVIAVEWPSRIASALPSERIDVRIQHNAGAARSIVISVSPKLADRLHGLDAAGGSDASEVKCRTCGTPFPSDADSFPFCSERCRLADLNESYRTSRTIDADDELQD